MGARGDKEFDPDWRALVARVGGLERSLKSAQEQRDKWKRRSEYLEHHLFEVERPEWDADIVSLFSDLRHAADCPEAACDRCGTILSRLEETGGRYKLESELAEEIDRARLAVAAAALLLMAARDQRPGARSRLHAAQHALGLALEGDLRAATERVAKLTEAG